MTAIRTQVDIPLGSGTVSVSVPNLIATVRPHPHPPVADPTETVRRALANPTGTPPLSDLARGKRDAVIVVNDYTRPYPGALMVREIAAVLNKAGIPDENIKLIVACGIHKPQDKAGLAALYGDDIVSRFSVVNHNAADSANIVSLGTTDGGVEVCVNKLFAEASLRIVTGLIAPHHAAGYSGGRKSVVPGVAGVDTLIKHHSFPIRPFNPAMGFVAGNPFHEEALKAARIAGTHFMVNSISNADKQLVAVVAGDVEKAWLDGVAICERIWKITLPSKADIVLVSPGGHPRDVDLQQSQKAVSSAELMCKPGGTIILCAACPNGLGHDYADYLKKAATPQEVLDTFAREGFDPNASAKAFHFARALVQFKVWVAGSTIKARDLEEMFMRGFATPQEAIDAAFAEKGPNARFLVCPVAYGLVVEERA